MDSPLLYENSTIGEPMSCELNQRLLAKSTSKTPNGQELDSLASDLNNPELSFDLQSYISTAQSGNSSRLLSLEDSLFRELLGESSNKVNNNQPEHTKSDNQVGQTGPNLLNGINSGLNNNNFQQSYQMPQQINRLADRFGSENIGIPVKQEPNEDQATDFSSNCSQNSGYSAVSQFSGFSPDRNGGQRQFHDLGESPSDGPRGPISLVHFTDGASPGLMGGRSPHSSGNKSHKQSKKNVDKASDEYKKRRERNNIAVRKSREKAKIRSRETEKKVSELQRDNDGLRKRVELLNKELNVLKALLSNVGVPPESVENEVAKSLQMDHHHHHHNNNPYNM